MAPQRWVLAVLRITLGWVFLYAGVSKIADPNWSAVGYLNNAKALQDFYAFLASPGMLPFTNVVNEWALALLGMSLLLGIGMRITAPLGALLMILYYIPIFQFPLIKGMSFIVDDHIIYSSALLAVAFLPESRYYSFAHFAKKIPLLS